MDKEKIKSFVRQTLGCGCSEDVFAHIYYECGVRPYIDSPPVDRINIGNRLLVYVTQASDADSVKKNLQRLVNAGVNERNAANFNRFRLVIAADRPDDIRPIADETFRSLNNVDDKMHLHVISRKDIPSGDTF